MTCRSREYLCGGARPLSTQSNESQSMTRAFHAIQSGHLSTVPAQPHPAMALLQHTALLQPKHSHRTIAFTQNMQAFSVFASIRSRTLHHWEATETQMHAKIVSWPRGRPQPTHQPSSSSAGSPTGDRRHSSRCSSQVVEAPHRADEMAKCARTWPR